jgi:hypothetical protein
MGGRLAEEVLVYDMIVVVAVIAAMIMVLVLVAT